MASFSITHWQVVDDHVVIQTLQATEVGTGQSVTVAGVHAGINGNHVILAVPTHRFLGVDDEGDFLFDTDEIIPNQLLFYDDHEDTDRQPLQPFGTLTWSPSCTWITNQKVVDWLGIASATANDVAFITSCVSAANAYAYRRRREAGYFDSLTTVPGGDVELGTVMYAATLYRERGSVDSFASFEQMGTPVPFGSHGQINRLLGINRSQVA